MKDIQTHLLFWQATQPCPKIRRKEGGSDFKNKKSRVNHPAFSYSYNQLLESILFAVLVFVLAAVTITVTITISITVTTVEFRYVVNYKKHIFQFILLHQTVSKPYVTLARVIHSTYINRCISHPAHHQSIRYQSRRCRVDKYIIIIIFQLLNCCIKRITRKKFSRVRRNRSRWQHM